MNASSKFEGNPIIYLAGTVRKLFDQSEAKKRHEFSGAWPKLIRRGRSHKERIYEVLGQAVLDISNQMPENWGNPLEYD